MEDINKDIEILENLLEEGFEAMCYPEAQAIEHLIQAYKELEEDNKQLKTRRIIGSIYDVKIEDLKDVLSPYYIPKSVIKEKIDKKSKASIKTRKNIKAV